MNKETKIKAKKSLGQNFLRDPKILKKIADFAQIEKGDTVVEVGPGEGTLTQLLLERASRVIAVEKDERLAERLRERFRQEIIDNRLQITVGDILETKIYNLLSTDYLLVGNIPYYITGAIFKKFLESEKPPKSLTFVVQKEVADRIMARDRKESILSISVKAYGEPKFGGVIKAGSFYPKPKVDSGILSVRNVNKERFKDGKIEEKRFFEVLKAGFAHKRKLLIKNLNSSKEVFAKLNINEKTRAEDLKAEDWVALTRELT